MLFHNQRVVLGANRMPTEWVLSSNPEGGVTFTTRLELATGISVTF